MHELKVFGQGRNLRWATILSIAAPLLILSSQLYAQAQPADSPSSFTVSGTVVNSVTHEALGRAMVYSMDSRYATFTDNSGRFELTMAAAPGSGSRDRLPPPAALMAKKPGFLTGQGAQGHAAVGPTTKEVTLSLVPEARVVGQVKFPSSETADQAQVVLYRREVRDGFGRWERLGEVRTRSDGEYRFAELRAGQYKVFTAEAMDRDPLTTGPGGPTYGFPPRFFAEAHDFASADAIEVRAGETFTANMIPERQRYYEVKIPVMPLQAAESGVTVAVRAQGHRGPGFELGYDQNEHAIRGSLPNGTYTIEGFSSGPTATTGTTSITVANGQVLGQPLTMTANPSIEVNVRMQLTATENSQVQAQAGQMPAAYATLQSAEEFSDERGLGGAYQSQVDPRSQGGPMVLQGVKPGRYWVQVQPSRSNLYAASVTSGLMDLLRVPLVVPVGASVPAIEVTLRDDGGTIEATVENAGEAVPGSASATATPYPGPARGELGTDLYIWGIPAGDSGGRMLWFGDWTNGKYRVQQVAPGDYRVVAFDSPQNIEWRTAGALRTYESQGQVVHVTAGVTTQVTLKVTSSEER